MSLRLTLRTLLAYLDDTLEPTQAKAIGQKVAESESARELMERIKLVTRRRKLTTPPPTGPGGIIDPNTVADYLDNEVTPEQAAEVEQICLSSDVHLAEVAACHQILTLILGEPLRPPASATQRMYGLVKGPETNLARKPPAVKAKAGPDHPAESKDIDETLRLGLPPLGRSGGWRNPLLLVGGGFMAAILLGVAIFQILNLSGNKEGDDKPDAVAQGNEGKDQTKGDKEEPGNDKDEIKGSKGMKSVYGGKKFVPRGKTDDETNDKPSEDKKDQEPIAPLPADEDVPFGPPNTRDVPIGNYLAGPKDYSILLQANPAKKTDWKRLTSQKNEVYSARPLLSLPGSKSVVQIPCAGLRLTLWGNMTPEFIYAIPGLFESQVVLYSHDNFDLDILLQRGRVVLTSTRSGGPVKIRMRFENPLIPSDKSITDRQEHFDIYLNEKGASLLVDRWGTFPLTESFYPKPNDPNRTGPMADMVCMALAGSMTFKTADLASYRMTAPPGPALFLWNSVTGPKGPSILDKALDFVLDNPPLPPGLDPKFRKDMVGACENLSLKLTGKEVDVGLANALSSSDSPQKGSDTVMRRLVVRSLAAVGDMSGLLEALDQPKYQDLRSAAIDALRDWIASSRDNDYKLFDLLKEKYKNKEAEIIMELLHPISPAELRRPERYDLLIDYLVNPNLVIRELGAWNLYRYVPAGKVIPYSAAADSQLRERAEAQWRQLIPPGQLPPGAGAQPPKKK